MQLATEVRTYTCICCPLGCSIEVSIDEDGCVTDVSGYSCARGKEYAANEAIRPERMVTAIVCAKGCLEPLSVKTASPVPKESIAEVLEAIRALRLEAPVRTGAVLIEDVCATGIAVIATKDIP
ncbi:DUF1667 domain-containing protein [Raoultibacter phocaeensis]|uniref:DUF1667 domain-containing protein n=1 Tax=Raoultibacter phocaeensis TaxID=2479841 RepID=UPI00111B19B3|nr:DUF1667 domain-containing protein [Raoultibacter phocaeensis]